MNAGTGSSSSLWPPLGNNWQLKKGMNDRMGTIKSDVSVSTQGSITCYPSFLWWWETSYTDSCMCKERRSISTRHAGGCCGVLLPGRMGLLCVFTAVNCDVSEPSVTQGAGFSLFVPLNCLQYADVMEQLVGRTGSLRQMTRRGKSCQRWNWTGTNAAFLQRKTHAYVSNDYWIPHSRGLPRKGTWWE